MANVKVKVSYPLSNGQMALRVSSDWTRDLPPSSTSGNTFTFDVPVNDPYIYFKPVIRENTQLEWSIGSNYVLSKGAADVHVYPYFTSEPRGEISGKFPVSSADGSRTHKIRVYTPPGYHENTMRHYPVVYMQDGANLFYEQEAASGEWNVDEVLDSLDTLSMSQKVIVVGIYTHDRNNDYTSPGYRSYGDYIINTLKPWVDANLRTLPDARNCAVMGSSLGALVSLYLSWNHPNVFGKAGCLSPAFWIDQDLRGRLVNDTAPDINIYMDSGAPGDDYEFTRATRDTLLSHGFKHGDDLLFLTFPGAKHNERFWANRLHIPFQFLFGTIPALG